MLNTYVLEKWAKTRLLTLRLLVTNENLRAIAIANFSPQTLDKDQRPTVRFSPTRMPAALDKQGKVLRHETEHFIHSTRRGYKALLVAKMATLFACTTAGSVYFGKNGFEVSADAMASWSEPIRIGGETVSVLAATAFGGIGGWISSVNTVKLCSPDELLAQHATVKRKDELRDGTLQILFK